MSDPNDDDLQREIAEYRRDLEYVGQILDAEKRLLRSTRLFERVVKNHFLTGTDRSKGLRALVQIRRRFLGRRLYDDACFAVDVRNRIAHDTGGGEPSETELSNAARVFIRMARKHLDAMAARAASADQTATTAVTKNGGNADVDVADDHDDVEENVTNRTQDVAETTASLETNITVSVPSPRIRPKLNDNRRPLLAATELDPSVTASTVAEYAFCPRAGLLTHESKRDDAEDELPALGRLPWYEADKIAEAYGRSCYKLFWMVVGLLSGFAIFSLTPLIRSQSAVIGLLLGVGAWVYFFVLEFDTWRILAKRRLEFKLAVPCEPNPLSDQCQEVDWFGLLAAGFDAREPATSLADEQWKLAGKPRRILSKGGIKIPVHRIRSTTGPPKTQHIVRAMAHCHLVNVSEGAESPYAVILFGDSYKGTTIPSTRQNREQFYEVLERVRAAIRDSDSGERQPSAPATSSPCRRCPHGRPRRASELEPTTRYGQVLDPFILVDRKNQIFHCSCGDRFREKPPHERNDRLTRTN